MTAPRIVVPGATTALTRRTTLRKAFLGPWHPLVSDCWLYALADAQRHTEVAVHHSTLVVNHHHTNVTPTHANLPEFARRFHRDFSCSVQALLASLRYDEPRELFDDRPTHMMRLLDPAAQAGQLVYERLNPVAAGLVRRPGDMPQRALDFGLWKTGYVEVDRPPVYFDRTRPKRLRLHLTPPPLLYEAFDGDVPRLVRHLERLVAEGTRALRAAHPRAPMGARALRRLHPWSEPRTMREPRGGRVPTFKLGAKGPEALQQRIEAAREVRAFRQRYRESRLARCDGESARVLPFGTYALRVHHGAPVEVEPPIGSRVARPGPVLAELAGNESAPDGPSDVHELTEAVGEALRLSSDEIVDSEDLDFTAARPETQSARPSARRGDEGPHARPLATARHHCAPRAGIEPRRVITLRDGRRGRPPSTGRFTTAPPR